MVSNVVDDDYVLGPLCERETFQPENLTACKTPPPGKLCVQTDDKST